MLACAEKRQTSIPPEAALLSRIVDVLVVYGDERLRRFLNVHLWRAGYQVREAKNAVGAGALILESAPDVMVLDLDAQGMHCFEFLAEIRADRAIPYFPVIYLTANMRAAACARELGAACVHKPVQPAKLLATVAMSPLIRRPPSSESLFSRAS